MPDLRYGIPGNADDLGLGIQTDAGKRLLPNRDVILENNPICQCTTRVRTNSLGYRGPEPGPKTARRVLFLGDSITLGDYLDEEDTFVRRVETLGRSRGTLLQTLNAGVPGIGLADELAILLETGLSSEPDDVVLGFYLNDVQPSRGMALTHRPPLVRSSRLLGSLAEAAARWRSRVEPLPDTVPPETLAVWREQIQQRFAGRTEPLIPTAAAFVEDWGSAWADGAWERLEPLLEEMARATERRGIRLLVVAFPLEDQVDVPSTAAVDHPQLELKRVGARLGVPVLDLLPRLREARGHGDLFYDHCHLSPLGNRLVAEWILEELERTPDRDQAPASEPRRPGGEGNSGAGISIPAALSAA